MRGLLCEVCHYRKLVKTDQFYGQMNPCPKNIAYRSIEKKVCQGGKTAKILNEETQAYRHGPPRSGNP